MVPRDKEVDAWWSFRLASEEAAMCCIFSLDSDLAAFVFEFRLYPKDPPPRPLALAERTSGDLEGSRSIVSGELVDHSGESSRDTNPPPKTL